MTRNLKADITRCAGRCWGRIMEGPRRQGGIVVVDPVYHVTNKVVYPDETSLLIARALEIRRRW